MVSALRRAACALVSAVATSILGNFGSIGGARFWLKNGRSPLVNACVRTLHTLSQPGRASIAAEHAVPALLEVASVEDSVQNRDGRPASDPPRRGNSSQPQTRRCHGVDRNDLEALNGLCLEWRVDSRSSASSGTSTSTTSRARCAVRGAPAPPRPHARRLLAPPRAHGPLLITFLT